KSAPPAERLDPRRANQIDERLPAAVENRDFEIIDLDESVIHAHAVKNTEQVFCCGDQDALPHQARRVADLLNVTPASRNAEPVKIGPDENDSRRRRCWKDSNLDRYAAMEANARRFDRALNG